MNFSIIKLIGEQIFKAETEQILAAIQTEKSATDTKITMVPTMLLVQTYLYKHNTNQTWSSFSLLRSLLPLIPNKLLFPVLSLSNVCYL